MTNLCHRLTYSTRPEMGGLPEFRMGLIVTQTLHLVRSPEGGVALVGLLHRSVPLQSGVEGLQQPADVCPHPFTSPAVTEGVEAVNDQPEVSQQRVL